MEQHPSPANRQNINISDRWVQHQRQKEKTTQSWACVYCMDRKIFHSADDLYSHALSDHSDRIPAESDGEERRAFRAKFEAESALKRSAAVSLEQANLLRQPRLSRLQLWEPTKLLDSGLIIEPYRNLKEDVGTRKQIDPLQTSSYKRPLPISNPTPKAQPRSLSSLQQLHLGAVPTSEDIPMEDALEDNEGDQPRKRAAVGDGISTGSGSPIRKSESPQPRRSKARTTSLPYGSNPDPVQAESSFDARPQAVHKQLWTPDQDSPLSRSSFDPKNIASVQTQRSRTQGLQQQQQKARKSFQAQLPNTSSRQQNNPNPPAPVPPTVLSSRTSQPQQGEEQYDLVMQPETRPISQEQLVAEVKGIYAGLVMVEAKCIEIDNKQAALAQSDGTQSKLNNEQWQALIALHRTLLHEHHDFFLASQHPSASPALRRLASKYAMPARMWRHGIHSFLELLRHRLPASLDHMLAFIYLAYTMMALLYETVPAFEDTWIECLGDLARYRMAIEDDDIRDREVWTGVARHWYSKASDKAPATGRLYHHLAILARPNALQQLFYYAKSLCVVVPFTSARESILTLFEPVLNADSQGQYRLPPLDAAFVKAHGLLFTGRNGGEGFKPAVEDFTNLLDNQIGRVTRKFMEQGYHIAVANSVAMLGFASKDNPLMRAISPTEDDTDTHMAEAISSSSFWNAQHIHNATLIVVLGRIGDPNVLPFIHVTLVFLYRLSRHPAAMKLLSPELPWQLLATMLNTLLATYTTFDKLELETFPIPEKKDDARPFPEDFAIRGLLWTDDYFPKSWFINDKIDEEEKYHELASMTAQRKERILWLAHQISTAEFGRLKYNSSTPAFYAQADQVSSRASTFASDFSATTTSTRTETWPPRDKDVDCMSDFEDEDVQGDSIPRVPL